MLQMISIATVSEKYNLLVLRERVLVMILMAVVVFFSWYLLIGSSVEQSINLAKDKRESLLSLSESIMSKYNVNDNKDSINKNIALIDKRMSSVKSKVAVIDEDIQRFNNETIAIGEIVLLLRDLLSANQSLSLESLKVYPSEMIKKNYSGTFTDTFEKNVISLTLKGSYSSVFDYLKKIESLKWSVFWQDVSYSVDAYPSAVVTIHLYTLSIIEDKNNGFK